MYFDFAVEHAGLFLGAPTEPSCIPTRKPVCRSVRLPFEIRNNVLARKLRRVTRRRQLSDDMRPAPGQESVGRKAHLAAPAEAHYNEKIHPVAGGGVRHLG